MKEVDILKLAYTMRQKQKEYFKRYDRGVLAEAKKLEKMLDEALDGYFHHENKAKQNDLFEMQE